MGQLKAGARLKSAVCETQVMVIAAPGRELVLTCGGAPMLELDQETPAGAVLDAAARGGTQLGKRYVNDEGDLELLCTRPGEGGLAADGSPLEPKQAKPLPSSD